MNYSRLVRRLATAVAVALPVALATVAAAAVPVAATSAPTISSFSPTSGPVGTLVTIKGSGFGAPAPGLQVSFAGVAAAFATAAPHKITVRVPPLAPTGTITVQTRYGSATSHSPFRLTLGIASFPRGAWPGQSITVAGSGFQPFHDVILQLDGASFGGVSTNANGEFSLIRALPGDITVGPSHVLVAIDSISHVQPKIHLWIFGNWPQPRNDPAQTSNATAEFLITPANAHLIKWHYAASPFDSPVVIDDGNIYAGTNSDSVAEFDIFTAPYPIRHWVGLTDGVVSQAPAVANGVVYVVTSDTLYAFAEHPSDDHPEALWTAVLGDSAHPFAPVVADGRVYVADAGFGELRAFDANGVTNCSGNSTFCTPLWFASYGTVFGPPAIDAKSAGGTGAVYLSVRNSGVDRVVVRSGAGSALGQSVALSSTSLSGPSLGGTRVLVSGWSAGTATATVYAMDTSTLGIQWNSSSLGGPGAPTAVAVGGGHTFVETSDATLRAFKASGCGTSVCAPLWSSGPGAVDANLTTPPTLANGVVFAVKGDDFNSGRPGLFEIEAFDANGCNAATCSYIAHPTDAGLHSQIVVGAGAVFGQGNGLLNLAELP